MTLPSSPESVATPPFPNEPKPRSEETWQKLVEMLESTERERDKALERAEDAEELYQRVQRENEKLEKRLREGKQASGEVDADDEKRLINYDALVYTGERLKEIGGRPVPDSPLPTLLSPYPSLHLLAAHSKTGKSSLSFILAIAWARGLSPWPGAPKLPGGRVLIISAEKTVQQIVGVMRRLTTSAGLGSYEDWLPRIAIAGRDPSQPRKRGGCDPSPRDLLRFDKEGLEWLEGLLQHAKNIGDPFGFSVFDSLLGLKPAEFSENSNDDMRAMLDPLADMAASFETYAWLIHHSGHTDRERITSAGRGASAIGDVPEVVVKLSEVPAERRQRKVEVSGNLVRESTRFFVVSKEPEPAQDFNRFHPLDDDPSWMLPYLFGAGVGTSLNLIARRIAAGAVASRPSHGEFPPPRPTLPLVKANGNHQREARRIVELLEKRGLIKVEGNLYVWER